MSRCARQSAPRSTVLILALTAALLVSAPALTPPASAQADDHTVNTTADTQDAVADGVCADAAGNCSIRAALAEPVSTSATTVGIPAGTYVLTGGPLNLGADPFTISGTAANLADVVIDANDGIGFVTSAGTQTIRRLRITNAANPSGEGGAISNQGAVLTLDGLIIDNSSADQGGAIHNRGALTIDSVMLRDNTARLGGGLYDAVDTGTIIGRTSFIDNVASDEGGGVYQAVGSLTSITNATFSGNRAQNGGAILLNQTQTTLNATTVTANTATSGTGGVSLSGTSASLSLFDSIVSGNQGGGSQPDDCFASSIGDDGDNVVGPSCVLGSTSSVITDDPVVGDLLTNEAGNLAIRPLALHSPALDFVGGCVAAVDMLGTVRPQNGQCDSGSHEHQAVVIDEDILQFTGGVPGGTLNLDDVDAETVRGPTQDANLAAAPLRDALPGFPTLAASPLAAIPLAAIPLAAIDLRASPLAAILLPDVPIVGGWEALLAGTDLAGRPPQTLTLGQALDNPQVNARFNDLTLEAVDIGATPLAAIPLAAIAIGAVPLAAIPLDGSTPGPDALQAWCDALVGVGHSCDDFGITPSDPSTAEDVTLTALALAGVPLAAIPLAAIPLAAIDLAQTPLAAIPLAAIRLAQSPLAAIPLAAIDIHATPLAAIPLAAIPLAAIPLAAISTAVAPLAAIPLHEINLLASPLAAIRLAQIPPANRNDVVDCSQVNCNNPDLTLLQVAAGIGVRPDAELGDLGTDAMVGFTLTDLTGIDQSDLRQALVDANLTLGDNGFDVTEMLLGALAGISGDTTVNQMVDAIDPGALAGVVLADLLYALVPGSAYPWADIDIADASVGGQAVDGTPSTVRLVYRVGGILAPTPVTHTYQLPVGHSYVEGSAAYTEDGDGLTPIDPMILTGDMLSFRINDVMGGNQEITFQLAPGTAPGSSLLNADYQIGPYQTSFNLPTPTAAGDPFEPNDVLADATPAVTGQMFLSTVDDAADIDLFAISVPQDGRLAVALDRLTVDLDIIVYGPPPGVIRHEPDQSIFPVEDTVDDLLAPQQDADAELTGDVPLAARAIVATSRRRDTAPERINLPPVHRGGTYVIQVSGHDGAFSADRYALRLVSTPPQVVAPCTATTRAFAGQGVPGVVPASLAPETDTLVLVAPGRLGDHYGAAAATAVMADLQGLAAAEVNGLRTQVIGIDGDPGVASALAAWDDEPCVAALANVVVSRIGTVLDGLLTPQVRHVVIVGDDTQIPFARIEDATTLANERGYASAVADVPAVRAPLGSGYFLSNDPYGDANPIQAGQRQLFIPDLAIGRLVESPAEIRQQIAHYLDFDGQLDPSTGSAAAGYDFLDDGTTAVADALDAAGRSTRRLQGDSWVRADLVTLLGLDGPADSGPGIASIAAHFDHNRALPALGNALGDEGDLFSVNDLTAALTDGSLLFSMGCHSGLSISDVRVAGAAPDWAQALAQQGAGTYAANTGYAYGDTEVVAYTERLMAEFAERLDGSMSIGQAMQYAKHAYQGQLGIVGVYDEKVLQESVLYGLPMYEIGGPGRRNAQTRSIAVAGRGAPLKTDPISGLPVERIDVRLDGPGDLVRVSGPRGDHWRGPDGTQVTHDRPIQPLVTRPLAGPRPRGALITALRSIDIAGVDPVISRPTIDLGDNEPEPRNAIATFPASPQRVTSTATPEGPQHQLNLIAGQFIASPDGSGTGRQRLFTAFTAEVFHDPAPGGAGPADIHPPTIRSATVAQVGPHMGLRVVTDDAEGDVVRVLGLYTDVDHPGTWRRVEFRNDGTAWTAGIANYAGSAIGLLVQAVDAAGNVAVSSDKSTLHRVDPPLPPVAGLTIALDGTQADDVFIGEVGVTVTGTGPGVQMSIDGATPTEPSGRVVVSRDGLHRVLARNRDGDVTDAYFLIDALPPALTIVSPTDGEEIVRDTRVDGEVVCSDAGVGIVGCELDPVDTAALGEHTIEARATDAFGRLATATVTYTVVEPPRPPASPVRPPPTPVPTSSAPPSEPPDEDPDAVRRIAGDDRFSTAAALVSDTFTAADTVFIASGRGFADVLSVGPAATLTAGGFAGLQPAGSSPLLLVEPDRLPASTARALDDLAPSRIIVIGGRAAVDDDVLQALGAHAATVDRVWGPDRYSTSAAVADRFFPQHSNVVWLATGANYPDALAAGAIAGAAGQPILLTEPHRLTPVAATTLQRLAPEQVIIVGGSAAISLAVEAEVISLTGADTRRIAGATRFETGALIAAEVDTPVDRVYVASGEDFPDALAVGPIAASTGSPIVLGAADRLPAPSEQALRRLQARVAIVVGGPAAIGDSVLPQIRALLRSG